MDKKTSQDNVINCELCGTKVKVVGGVTLWYEPIKPDKGDMHRVICAINLDCEEADKIVEAVFRLLEK